MTENPTSQPEKHVCPTCGTKLSEGASRCAVCGTEIVLQSGKAVSSRRSDITISLPLLFIIFLALALIAAGLTYAATSIVSPSVPDTPTSTITLTPTVSQTATATATETLVVTETPLPPIEYTVVEGDTCGGVAFFFQVSVRSIIDLNNLGTQCLLSVGQTILVPQPTPTATVPPTATLSAQEATVAACPTVDYTVEANDTLFGIAQNYNVTVDSIKNYNGLATDTVFEGQRLVIPLCERLGEGGATPTPTLPPPYPAPNLLLPRDGQPFTLADDNITLQWAAIGTLRENEFYKVVVQDVTVESEGTNRRTLIDYVTDTKYIVPVEFRPGESMPHVIRWWIEPVRLIGSSSGGEPRYESAGAVSLKRAFAWSGTAPDSTPTP